MKTVLLFLSLLLSCGAAAQSENWAAINLAVVDDQLIPLYQRLAETGTALGGAGERFCDSGLAQDYRTFVAAYHKSMDAWQAIQHIEFGPITYINWYYRIQYWPDDKGTGPRQLSALLAGRDDSIFSVDNFPRQSVGVQGFPALERLLFEDNALAMLQEDAFRCRFAQVISANIAGMSVGVHQRWVEEFRATVMNPEDSGFFEDSKDLSISLMRALVQSLPRLKRQKLEPVLGENRERSRLKKAESWRAERSLRNIRINVDSLYALFNGSEGAAMPLKAVLADDKIEAVNAEFGWLKETLAVMPDGFEAVLQDQERYRQLQELSERLITLDHLLEAAVQDTELYLGFSGLDGD